MDLFLNYLLMWQVVPTAAAIGTAATFARPFGKYVVKRLKQLNWKPRRGNKRQKLSSMPRSRGRSGSSMRSASTVASYYGDALGLGNGHYRGRLPKPRKAARPSKYDKYGYSAEVERFGSQSLAEVAYIGCTSVCHADILGVVGVAFIRSLMKRHYQFEYTSSKQLVNYLDLQGFGPSRIEFYYEEVTAADVEPTIAVGWSYNLGSKTLDQFALDFATNVLQSNTFGANTGGSNYPIRRLHGYMFWQRDFIGTPTNDSAPTVERGSTLHCLRNQYLTVYSATTFGIQNITPADDGAATDRMLGNRIDSNPIKGKLYRFSDNLPKLQQRRGAFGSVTTDNSYKLQLDVNGDGIIKPSTAITGDWQQVPTAAMFANCVGELSVRLEPGDIKDYQLMFKFNGTLQKFIDGMAPDTYPLQKDGFGTSCLFCLEKRMPTGFSANVSVNFQYENRTACVFGKRLGMLMQRGADQGRVVTVA